MAETEFESDELADIRAEIAALRRQVEEQKRSEDALKKEFDDYRQAEQKKENQRLRTALIAAGGIIIGLGGFVWWEIVWPVIKGGRT